MNMLNEILKNLFSKSVAMNPLHPFPHELTDFPQG